MKRNIAHITTLTIVIVVLIEKLINLGDNSFFLWYISNIISSIIIAIFLFASMREKPNKIDDTWRMFFVSVISTNIPLVVSVIGGLFPISTINNDLQLVANIINVLTMPYYIWGLLSLGKNLTILPEVHEIVVKGAYRFSRHPLYLVYIVWYITQIFIFQTWTIIFCSIIQIVLILIRAKKEEQILVENNDTYLEYMKNVSWIQLLPIKKIYKKNKGSILIKTIFIFNILFISLFVTLCSTEVFANEKVYLDENFANVEGYNEIDKFVDDLETITEETPFDDIIEKSEEIVEKNKDNPIVKFFKKLADVIFDFLNSILEKARESILEMIKSNEEFKIID